LINPKDLIEAILSLMTIESEFNWKINDLCQVLISNNIPAKMANYLSHRNKILNEL